MAYAYMSGFIFDHLDIFQGHKMHLNYMIVPILVSLASIVLVTAFNGDGLSHFY